jgi:hypothetical protein
MSTNSFDEHWKRQMKIFCNAELSLDKDWQQQPTSSINLVCLKVSRQHQNLSATSRYLTNLQLKAKFPELAKFKEDWFSKNMIKVYLRNHNCRKYIGKGKNNLPKVKEVK